MVFCDQPSLVTIVIFWGVPQSACLRQQALLFNMCILTAALTGYSPISLPPSVLSNSWNMTVLKLGQLITLQCPLSV